MSLTELFTQHFTRIRALALILTVVIILLTTTFTSAVPFAVAGCNNPPQIEQCGVATCTIGTGTLFCDASATFNPIYPSRPTVTFGPCGFNPTCPTAIGNAFVTPLLAGTDITFLSTTSAGQTWANQPLAVTELFGDIHHEAIINLNSLAVTAIFSFDCLTPIFSANTYLSIQVSNNAGTTWGDQPNSHVIIDSTSTCGSTTSTEVLSTTWTNFQQITPCPCNTVLLRVVGANGDGTNSPTFNNIHVQFLPSSTLQCFPFLDNVNIQIAVIRTLCPIASPNNQIVAYHWRASI